MCDNVFRGAAISTLLTFSAFASIVNIGLLENHPINMTFIMGNFDNVSNINITTILLPFNQPFIMLQEDIAASIDELDDLMAPEDECSTIYLQLLHFRHTMKRVTCYSLENKTVDQRAFFPPALWYIHSIIETLRRLNWYEVIILGPYEKELWSLSEELTANGVLCLTFQYHLSDTVDDLFNLINTTITTDDGFIWNYLLLGPEQGVHSVLRQAADFDTHNHRRSDVRSSSKWLVVKEDGDLELFNTDHWLDNVAVMIYPAIPYNWPQEVDVECVGNMFTLMYHRSADEQVTRRLLHIGNFDCLGNVKNNTQLYPNMHYGFNGRHFIASTVRWAPFTIVQNTSDGLVFEGLCVDMLHQLSLDLNFTYTVKLPVDGEWGQELSPMNWSGMVGELQRNEIDMTVAALTISSSRLKVMDFTYPFGYDKGVGVYRVPDTGDSQWKTLFFPYSWEVHMWMLVSFIFSVMFLYWLRWLHRNRKDIPPLDFGEDALLVWGMFIRYSYEVKTASTSTSFFISAIWCFGTVATAVYCGNLMAFFAVTKEHMPFTTIPEVAAQTTYKWGTQGGTFWVNIFEYGESDDYKAIWKGIQTFNSTDPDVLHKSEYLHRQKVEAGNYVFFVESDMLKGWAKENCELRLLTDSVYQVQYGIGLPFKSPYTSLISKRLIAFSEEGLLVAWKKKWWRGEDACSGDDQIKTRILGTRDLQSAFYVLLIGISLASLTFVYEKCMVFCKMKCNKRGTKLTIKD